MDFAYANQLGFRIKLVGVAEPGLIPRMETCLLPLASQLAKVNGVLNAVEFHGEPVGSVLAVGPGAGGGATSSAVLSDLIDIAAGRGGLPFGQSINTLVDVMPSRIVLGQINFYVRLMVVDQPGVLATLTESCKNILFQLRGFCSRVGRLKRGCLGNDDARNFCCELRHCARRNGKTK